MENNTADTMLRFQLRRLNTNQFKRFLDIIDRLKNEHDETLRKLRLVLPSQYHQSIDLANALTNDKKEFVRKEILSVGNDTYRGIETELEQFEINFK